MKEATDRESMAVVCGRLSRLLTEDSKNVLPEHVDLVEFGFEAERLQALSVADTGGAEFASTVVLSAAGRTSFNERSVRGSRGGVCVATHPDHTVLAIHSHGNVNSPFSLADLRWLLAPFNNRSARRRGALISTRDLKLLVLTDAATPTGLTMMLTLPRLADRVSPVTRPYAPPRLSSWRGDPDLWQRSLEAESSHRMFRLTRLAPRLGLHIYSCPLHDNIASLVA